jgi:hypothetical protein
VPCNGCCGPCDPCGSCWCELASAGSVVPSVAPGVSPDAQCDGEPVAYAPTASIEAIGAQGVVIPVNAGIRIALSRIRRMLAVILR